MEGFSFRYGVALLLLTRGPRSLKLREVGDVSDVRNVREVGDVGDVREVGEVAEIADALDVIYIADIAGGGVCARGWSDNLGEIGTSPRSEAKILENMGQAQVKIKVFWGSPLGRENSN